MAERRDRHALPESAQEQYAVLEEALDIYLERHRARGDLWVRYGWRGALHEARVACERAWRRWFSAEPVVVVERRELPIDQREPVSHAVDLEVDELLDTINYAAMAIRAIRAGNRDGTAGWWDGV